MSPRLSCGLLLACLGVALWINPGMASKIERFTDPAGTLHISNFKEGEPGKPGTATPALPGQPQAFPQAVPAVPPEMEGGVAPPQPEDPGMEMEAEPAAPEAVQDPAGQPQPVQPPAMVPGQQLMDPPVAQ